MYDSLSLVLERVTFTNNKVFLTTDYTTSLGQGGAMATQVTLLGISPSINMTDCDIRGNQAMEGGALSLGSGCNHVLTNCTFTDNWADESVGVGGAVSVQGGLILQLSKLVNNTGYRGGGVYYVAGGDYVHIVGTTFDSNTATSGNGGAIYVPGAPSDLNIVDSVFNKNTAIDSSGGALYFAGTNLTVKTSNFTENTCSLKGGAIAVVGNTKGESPSVAYFVDCGMFDNASPVGGGALYVVSSASVTLTNSHLGRNKSPSGGAVLAEELAILNVNQGSCVGNVASLGGGCLSAGDYANVTLTGFTMADNQGLSEGGALRMLGSASVNIADCTMTGNVAETGGAVWLEQNATMSATSSNLTSNVGSIQAGAIYCTHSTAVDMVNCQLSLNNALGAGAVLAEATAKFVASSTTFASNSRHAMVLHGNATVLMDNVTFFNNSADVADGGALLVQDQAFLSISNSKLAQNQGVNGGGIRLEGGSTSLTSTTLSNNSAMDGGAVSTGYTSELSVIGCIFVNNTARFTGGAISMAAEASGTLRNSSFTGNEAGEQGAGVFIQRYALTTNSEVNNLVARDLKFAKNDAPASQGAAYFDASYEPTLRTQCSSCISETAADTIGALPASFLMMWGDAMEDTGGNKLYTVRGSTDGPVVGLEIKILDALGNLAIADNSSVAIISADPRISGLLRGTAQQGVVQLPPVEMQVSPAQAVPFALNITVRSPSGAYPDIVRQLQLTFCNGGQFYNATTYSCEACQLGSWCAAGQAMVACPDNSFTFLEGASDVSQCAPCSNGNGLDCYGGQASVEWNYWLDMNSINTSSPTVYQCDILYGCPGYNFTGPDVQQCGVGYNQNRMCSSCAPGYFMLVQTCEKCGRVFTDIFPFLIIVVILAWVGLNVLSNYFLTVDVFINELQIVAMIGAYNLNTPKWMAHVLQYYGLVNFDPDLVGPECRLNYNYDRRWAVAMLIPIIGLLCYTALYVFQKTKKFVLKKGDEVEMRHHTHRDRKYSSDFLFGTTNWLDICYASVILRCFEAFQSQQLDVEVMGSAPYIEWGSSTHHIILIVSIFVTIVYVVGVPIMYAGILIYGKTTKSLEEFSFKLRFGWLTDRFKADYYWWHMLSISRRVVFAAITVFLGLNHPSVALAVSLPIQAGRIGLQYSNSPYAMSSMDMLNSTLILGEFLFTLGLACWNYLNLHSFANILFALSIMFIIPPTLLTLTYEAINKYVEWRNSITVAALHKSEGAKTRQLRRSNMTNLSVDEMVRPAEICEWFRPHIVYCLLHSQHIKLQRQLLKIRQRFEECKLVGLGSVAWIRHLSKNQLYAVLAQALMGAGAGNMTIARVPLSGGLDSGPEMFQESTTGSNGGVADTPKGGVSWPPRLDRHVSWTRREEEEPLTSPREEEEDTSDAAPATRGAKQLELNVTTVEYDENGNSVRRADAAFVEARMNMAELTLTFQRHLSLLVHAESKKGSRSLRALVRSDAVPYILAWLTSSSSTHEDQKLLSEFIEGLRELAFEEAGGIDWWSGLFYCFRSGCLWSRAETESTEGLSAPVVEA